MTTHIILEKEEIAQKLIEVCQKIRPATIQLPEMVKDLGFDRIDMIEFVIEVEDAFDITVDDDKFFKLERVDNLVAYIGECKTIKNV